jgi:hypothetical protein
MVDDNGKVREVDAARTTQQRGKLIAMDDKEHYFFTPQLMFKNLVAEESPRTEFYMVSEASELFEVKNADGSVTMRKAAVVCWRVLACGVFQNTFDLHKFPFDSQTLAIQLLSDWDVKDVRLVRNMKAAYQSVIQDGAFQLKDEYESSRMLHMMPTKSNPKARRRAKERNIARRRRLTRAALLCAQDSSSGVTRSTLHIEMCIRRKRACPACSLRRTRALTASHARSHVLVLERLAAAVLFYRHLLHVLCGGGD